MNWFSSPVLLKMFEKQTWAAFTFPRKSSCYLDAKDPQEADIFFFNPWCLSANKKLWSPSLKLETTAVGLLKQGTGQSSTFWPVGESLLGISSTVFQGCPGLNSNLGVALSRTIMIKVMRALTWEALTPQTELRDGETLILFYVSWSLWPVQRHPHIQTGRSGDLGMQTCYRWKQHHVTPWSC